MPSNQDLCRPSEQRLRFKQGSRETYPELPETCHSYLSDLGRHKGKSQRRLAIVLGGKSALGDRKKRVMGGQPMSLERISPD